MKGLALTALVLSLFFSVEEAQAASKIFDPKSFCSNTNCQSDLIRGTYTHDQNNNSEPFTLQVFTSGNECVRIEVIAQGTDLEMSLVCPRGTVWVNDDGGAGLRPLIKAITPPDRGWCTVQLAHYLGEGVNADFTMRYGRYGLNNPNCSSPTPPAFSPGPGPAKADELVQEETLDGPSAGGS